MKHRKWVNYRSVSDLNRLVLQAIPGLPKEIDLVVAIPRSGYLAAGLIALNLNRPLCSYSEYLSSGVPEGGRRAKSLTFDATKKNRVLIVDDSVSSGWEIRRVRQQLSELDRDDEIIILAAFANGEVSDLVDIALEITNPPQIFEWNIYHHPHLINSCVDIDGVLCRDCLPEEDDDGPNYLRFLKHTEPRFLPSVEIGMLVTSRLEKYRAETQEWLARHNVRYEALIMQDLPDLETRQRLGSDATFKAGVFEKSDKFLFVESSAWQAQTIASTTGKAVFCTDNHKFFQADAVAPEIAGSGGGLSEALKSVQSGIGAVVSRLKPLVRG